MRHACTLSWLRSLRQWLSHATKRGCGRGAQALFDFCMAQNNPSFGVCTRLQGYVETSPGFAGRPAAICNMARSFPRSAACRRVTLPHLWLHKKHQRGDRRDC